jgi:hypothetical protein
MRSCGIGSGRAPAASSALGEPRWLTLLHRSREQAPSSDSLLAALAASILLPGLLHRAPPALHKQDKRTMEQNECLYIAMNRGGS